MYGNIRTPFAPPSVTDLHSTRSPLPNGAIANLHYPNYHLYNIPASHGHHHMATGGISTALARQYANMASMAGHTEGHHGHHSDYRTHAERDYTPDSGDDMVRRRGSAERRASGASGANRRGSGSTGPTADTCSSQLAKKQQRFEILRKLGSGTYGKVSLAMDHKAGEEVAIKVIRKSAIENTSDLIRIRREIRIMSALKHPNIIEIKEVFENNEKIILVMEYASGGELYDFVGKHGPLPEEEVRRIFRQIVSAVFYCHRHGVAHRDLKLENILLDKGMSAKIADFGLSNYFTDHMLLRTFCGSPLYASPEIINGTPYRGPEVDCWSLGVLLYTLAYSSMPFDGRDFNRMARQIKRGAYYEPDPPSSASMLIRSMLRVNPDRRATISDIAAHWWLNFDDNSACIAELPENQVLDSTPLYIRQETMMIQSFGEENEMFAEFNHLSDATRKKIEEFRRRRREAEWYLIECQTPLKKQSKKRSSSIVNEQQKRQSSQALMSGQKRSGESSVVTSGADMASRKDSNAEAPKKNLSKSPYTAAEIAAGQAGGLPDEQLLDNLSDPLNRLKALETRLQYIQSKEKTPVKQMKNEDSPILEAIPSRKTSDETGFGKRAMEKRVKKVDQTAVAAAATASSSGQKQKPKHLKMSVDDLVQEKRALDQAVDNATVASLTSAVLEEANRMVNQLLEEAMKGNVPMDLVEKIKKSDAYRTEPFVKEILESVLSAHQAKPPIPPTPPVPRSTSRSKSRPSSITRVPKSGSASATPPPLPDVISSDGEKATPPPDVVSVSETAASEQAAPPPSAVATPQLAPMKLIYEPVPEDAELQLPAPSAEVPTDTPVTPSSSEQEEDVCSTDFEDLGSEEDDEEGLKGRSGEESPGSAAASFVTAHSAPPESSAVIESAPVEVEGVEQAKATVAATGESEENPFLRGLSKRLSRGKYERSKYFFGRGLSTDETKGAKKKLSVVEKKSKEEKEKAENAEESGGQVENATKSICRRRYSDGDKGNRNRLTPIVDKENWMKKSDSDLGSNQEMDNGASGTNGSSDTGSDRLVDKETTGSVDEGLKGIVEDSASTEEPATPNPSEDTPVKDQAKLDLIDESKRRRRERAKLKQGLRTESQEEQSEKKESSENALKLLVQPAEEQSAVENTSESDKTKLDKSNGDQEKQAKLSGAKEKKAKVNEAKEKPGKSDEAKEKQVKPNGKEAKPNEAKKKLAKSNEAEEKPAKPNEAKASEAKPKKIVKKTTKRQSSVADATPKLESESDKTARRASAADASLNIPISETTPSENKVTQQKAIIYDEPTPHKSPSPPPVEQRRNSFRTYGDSGSNISQDGDKHSSHLSRSSLGLDHHSSGPPRSSKYQQLASGGVAVADPPWLQYAREETHRLQQQGSPYHHAYGAGDSKSSFAHGSDRFDDDYHGVKSSLSYRTGGTYSSRDRDLSPPRMAPPVFRNHADPLGSVSLAYDNQTSFSSARKQKPLYHQASHDEDSGISSSKRYTPVITGYAPTYTRRTTGSGDYYRSLYDDNVVYRRSHYDVQPSSNDDDWKSSTADTEPIGRSTGRNQFRVFQPRGLLKRRSRSLDKMNGRFLPDEDDDTGNYHYQSGGTAPNRYESSHITGTNYSTRHPPVDFNSRSPLKSILKKQPTFDDPTSTPSVYTSRYRESENIRKQSEIDTTTRPFNFIERIKRHLSTDKPSDTSDYVLSSNNYRSNDNPIGYGDSSGLYPTETGDIKQTHKKRNFIPSTRRRTTEIRYGASAADNGDEYGASSKRPISPIEKIKGFFGGTGTKPSGTTGATGATGSTSGFHYSAAASPFATYQPNSTNSTSRDTTSGTNTNYTPGYRKGSYQAGGHRAATSYIPSSRYFYEDPSLY